MSQFTYVTMLHEHCTATLYQHRLSLDRSYRPSNHLTDKSFARELLRRVAFIFMQLQHRIFEIAQRTTKAKSGRIFAQR